jgi:hypothetical protein
MKNKAKIETAEDLEQFQEELEAYRDRKKREEESPAEVIAALIQEHYLLKKALSFYENVNNIVDSYGYWNELELPNNSRVAEFAAEIIK